MAAVTAPLAPLVSKPRLRGVLHLWAFFASLASGTTLLLLVPSGRATTAAAIYGASVSALLGVSALYHRVHWSAGARRWMGRLDHAMIAFLIAGTFTPFGMHVLTEASGTTLLATVWIGALVAAGLHVLWIDAPKWLSAVVYVVLGWTGIAAMPEMVARAGGTPTALLAAGGLCYSAGAVVYALRRPDPFPAVFGYHEVFHALVVVAAGAHYAAVALCLVAA
jgi:hemolysin III